MHPAAEGCSFFWWEGGEVPLLLWVIFISVAQNRTARSNACAEHRVLSAVKLTHRLPQQTSGTKLSPFPSQRQELGATAGHCS